MPHTDDDLRKIMSREWILSPVLKVSYGNTLDSLNYLIRYHLDLEEVLILKVQELAREILEDRQGRKEREI